MRSSPERGGSAAASETTALTDGTAVVRAAYVLLLDWPEFRKLRQARRLGGGRTGTSIFDFTGALP